MNSKSFLQNIQNTRDEEISCSECFDLSSLFVELELTIGDHEIKMPHLRQHLNQCSACREEYETLRDLVRLENKGEILSVDGLKNLIP